MKSRLWLVAVAPAALTLAMALSADAQRARTPEANSFEVWVDDAEHLIVGIVETVPGTDEGVGFTIRCERGSGQLEGSMAFGFFPAGKRVQASVRSPSGRVERFGPVVVGGRASGFHVPVYEGRHEVLRLMEAVLVNGALISNGHNSVWNKVGKTKNGEARKALRECAGGGQ